MIPANPQPSPEPPMHASLTTTQIDALVDTTEPGTGITFPPLGLQPYHTWLIDTLHRLAASAVPQFRIAPADPDQPTLVYAAPGRAIIDQTTLDFPGQTLDLAPWNNQTARLYLIDNAGTAELAANSDWPVGAHLKLAEATLSQGAITQITDLRLQPLFTA
ncbi:MAG: hypothetical protein AAF750_03415 [Planctomycetota bacterium]